MITQILVQLTAAAASIGRVNTSNYTVSRQFNAIALGAVAADFTEKFLRTGRPDDLVGLTLFTVLTVRTLLILGFSRIEGNTFRRRIACAVAFFVCTVTAIAGQVCLGRGIGAMTLVPLAGIGLGCLGEASNDMKALLTTQQVNKTDRNDARGIAQMMRVGLFKPVHVKTLAAQEQRMLLTSRKLLQRKLLDVGSDLRGTLRNFGLKVGIVSGSRYEARVRELVLGFPRLAAIAEPLINVRRVMRQQLAVLHKMLLDTVRGDPVCRRLMTAPGVGAVVALTYRVTVDRISA
jgi:hypothetical protein